MGGREDREERSAFGGDREGWRAVLVRELLGSYPPRQVFCQGQAEIIA